MSNVPNSYYSYTDTPMYTDNIRSGYGNYPYGTNYTNSYYSFSYSNDDWRNALKDYWPNPFVININEATKQNNTYRTALWTG